MDCLRSGLPKLIDATPALLSLVALGLTLYALVDFANFVQEYRVLEDEVEAQSQEDFDFLAGSILEIFQLARSFGSTDLGYCEEQDTGAQFTLDYWLNLVDQSTERFNRVSVALLPPGPVWNDYFVAKFPTQDGYDYGHLVNPTRIPVLALYGVPNLEPLFRTFTASLVFDIVSVCLVFLPFVVHKLRPQSNNRLLFEKIMLGVDAGFLMVSVALLGTTVRLARSTDGYDVETVRGRLFLIETTIFNEELKNMINPEYWKPAPEQYCQNNINPCHPPEYSYQKNCSVALIDISVPTESILRRDDKWFLDLEVAGSTVFERNALRGYEAVLDDPQNSLITEFFNFTFNYLLPSIPEEFTNVISTLRDNMASACPYEHQEFFWTDTALETVSFPLDSPDYDHVCNVNCEHNWTTIAKVEDCLNGCNAGQRPLDFTEACSSNCPTVDASNCGCGSFNMGLWKYNCTSSSMQVITVENYNKFTNFAVENVREGLKFDIAATLIDFIAICIGAIILLTPRIRKWIWQDDSSMYPDQRAQEFGLRDQRTAMKESMPAGALSPSQLQDMKWTSGDLDSDLKSKEELTQTEDSNNTEIVIST